MAIIGYGMVSPFSRDNDDLLKNEYVDIIFSDVCCEEERPELSKALASVHEGDTLVVYSVDRLARNFKDLYLVLDTLADRAASLRLVKEILTIGPEGTNKSTIVVLLQLIAAMENIH